MDNIYFEEINFHLFLKLQLLVRKLNTNQNLNEIEKFN